MNRRSMLKFIAAIPFVGLVVPKVVLAAHREIEWRYEMFDFNCQLGVAGIVLFDDPKYGLRMKRAAARFVFPPASFLDGNHPDTGEEAAQMFPDLVRQSKLAVIEQFRTDGTGVVYDDNLLEGKEVRVGKFISE